MHVHCCQMYKVAAAAGHAPPLMQPDRNLAKWERDLPTAVIWSVNSRVGPRMRARGRLGREAVPVTVSWSRSICTWVVRVAVVCAAVVEKSNTQQVYAASNMSNSDENQTLLLAYHWEVICECFARAGVGRDEGVGFLQHPWYGGRLWFAWVAV